MIKFLSSQQLKGIRKILIMQYKPFGDVLLNTGYLPALRAKFPDAQIDFLVQKPYAILLENNPNLDNLVLMDKIKKDTLKYVLSRFYLIKKIRSNKYDVIIDQARGPGASQIVFFSGAKFRLGWLKTKKLSWLKGYNWVYNYKTIKNNDIYSARAKFEMLRPLGIEEEPHNTFYFILPESKKKVKAWLKESDLLGKKIVVFSPVTPIRTRQWKFEYFARTADIMIEKFGFKVVLLWGPREKEKVEGIASQMKHKPFITPATSFNEAGAILQHASVYIGNNGGVHHLSVAVKTPTLTVFGPNTEPFKWTAWDQPIHSFVKNNDRKEYIDGTFGVTPEMVSEKLEELIADCSSLGIQIIRDAKCPLPINAL